MKNYRHCQGCLLASLTIVFVLVAYAAPMQAVEKPMTSGDILPVANGKWKVEFADPVKLTFDDADTPRNTVGTMKDVTERADDKATVITFTQTEKLDKSSDANEGLRLNFAAKVKNATTKKWNGYTLQLIDDQPVAETPPDTDHPPWPHFHPKIPGTIFAPFKFDRTRPF